MGKTKAPHGKKLLTFDISSTCVGYAVFEEGNLIEHGRFNPKGSDHSEKLASFSLWLAKLFKRVSPKDVAVETPYPGRRKTSYGVLQMYFGLFMSEYSKWAKGPLPDEARIAASQVKRLVGVKSGTDYYDNKRIMVEAINKLYGLELVYKKNDKTKKVSQDDEADAIAVGCAWYELHGDVDDF